MAQLPKDALVSGHHEPMHGSVDRLAACGRAFAIVCRAIGVVRSVSCVPARRNRNFANALVFLQRMHSRNLMIIQITLDKMHSLKENKRSGEIP